LPAQAWAWGADGHRLVATVAEGLLTPAAKAEADLLLAQEPGSTLASIWTWADDKGGNAYQLQAFDRGTNLHSLWDSGLIRNWPGGLPALQAAMTAESGAAGGAPKDWAEASCRIVGTDGFYPATHTLDEEYPGRWSATLVQQLSAGSRRLADLLNTILGSR
jgi:hypothetical protein